MILHLVGGRRDGDEADASDLYPEPVVFPDTLEVDCHPANRTAYRLVRVEGDDGWYQIDRQLTEQYRSRRRP